MNQEKPARLPPDAPVPVKLQQIFAKQGTGVMAQIIASA